MAFKSKVQNKFLTGQSREIISSLLQFMTLEAHENAPIIPLSKVLQRLNFFFKEIKRTSTILVQL
jgi:hypothetical protein